jgi:hypothetical protein
MQALTEQDLDYVKQHGLSPEEVQRQIDILKKGLPHTEILAPATINDGIIKLSEEQKKALLQTFETNKNNYTLQKFVPASGAATRMFKDWHFFHQNYQPGRHYYERFVKQNKLKSFEPDLDDFLNDFSGFPFYEDLMQVISENMPGYFQLDENEQAWHLIHYTLSEEGLNYGQKPKALIKFHRYNKNDIRTALEEHLVEADTYTKTNAQEGQVMFSISPQHQKGFEELFDNLKDKYPVATQTSYQKPETDTVMLDLGTGDLVRNENGQLVFRPGGHGSLINNLQDLNADIVFVKNIDNVQKGDRQQITEKYKKILAGYLMDLLEKNKRFLTQLRDEKPIHEDLKAIEDFAKNELNIRFIEGYDTLNNSGKRKYLAYKMNRPIRVAGMVKNTGEPGGGPFWAKDQNGIKSLQIVEKAQIDTNNPEQKAILESATHFNPVDLVLSLKDFEGQKFDLKKFVNEQAGFITEKSYNGRPVKVYERPGLWNGGMDGWNTVFVEVPLDTFTPVKTVTDLLKPEHQ